MLHIDLGALILLYCYHIAVCDLMVKTAHLLCSLIRTSATPHKK